MAKPFTAAITGFSSAPDMNGSSMAGRCPPGAPRCSNSFMSSPAQKPRPVPVKMATSSSLLWRNSVQVSGELGAHLVAEGVEALGSVHAHHEHLSVTFGFHNGHVLVLPVIG